MLGGGAGVGRQNCPAAEVPGGALAGQIAGRCFGRPIRVADTASKPNHRNTTG